MGRGPIVLAVLALAGCGPDEVLPPDATPPAGPLCGPPDGTITAIPGEFTGRTVGAGADLTDTDDECADQRLWFGSDGEDQVVEISGLTPGEYYVIDLDTGEDLAFYVATACDAAGPAAGACLLHVDVFETLGESAELIAPPGGRIAVIVDSANVPVPPATGDYTLRVRHAECVPGPHECTDPVRTICADYACVQCTSAFDCAAATPACDATGTCIAGPAACTGDDPAEPDDGPSVAQVIAPVPPTAGNPTVMTAAVCSRPATEFDWYTFTLAAPAAIRFELAWADAAADLDLYLGDEDGLVIDRSAVDGPGPEAFADDLAAGTYYVLAQEYAPADDPAAIPYTLTLAVPDCTNSFDCGVATAPHCDDTRACTAGPAACTGDDAADAGTGDDGPAAAQVVPGGIGVPRSFTAAACDVGGESDWYRVTVAAGQGLTIDLTFAAPGDFALDVFDAAGAAVGRSWWVEPGLVELTYLPAGAYLARVGRTSDVLGGDPAAEPYTITFTRSAAQSCATAADCAAVYAHQLYRGLCTGAGTCAFLPDGARPDGAACDSGGDCGSGLCSYRHYEADAAASICTTPCSATGDCAALGSGLTCTTGFSPDVCVPACLTALDCGANELSSTVDAGEPWNYFDCAVATGECGAP